MCSTTYQKLIGPVVAKIPELLTNVELGFAPEIKKVCAFA
jgi:hypothetical protein